MVIFVLARVGRSGLTAAAVGAYIGAAYLFTSSTSFANSAITIGRMFSDTSAGIAPSSAPGFVAAQLVGAALGFAPVRWFYPERRIVPDAEQQARLLPVLPSLCCSPVRRGACAVSRYSSTRTSSFSHRVLCNAGLEMVGSVSSICGCRSRTPRLRSASGGNRLAEPAGRHERPAPVDGEHVDGPPASHVVEGSLIATDDGSGEHIGCHDVFSDSTPLHRMGRAKLATAPIVVATLCRSGGGDGSPRSGQRDRADERLIVGRAGCPGDPQGVIGADEDVATHVDRRGRASGAVEMPPTFSTVSAFTISSRSMTRSGRFGENRPEVLMYHRMPRSYLSRTTLLTPPSVWRPLAMRLSSDSGR